MAAQVVAKTLKAVGSFRRPQSSDSATKPPSAWQRDVTPQTICDSRISGVIDEISGNLTLQAQKFGKIPAETGLILKMHDVIEGAFKQTHPNNWSQPGSPREKFLNQLYGAIDRYQRQTALSAPPLETIATLNESVLTAQRFAAAAITSQDQQPSCLQACQGLLLLLTAEHKRLLQLPGSFDLRSLNTAEFGGKHLKHPNFASGNMSTVSKVTLKGDVSAEKIWIAKPLTHTIKEVLPAKSSGIPHVESRLGQRSLATYACARWLGYDNLVPKTVISIVDGHPNLLQAFVDGEDAVKNSLVRSPEQDGQALARDIMRQGAELGLNYCLEERGQEKREFLSQLLNMPNSDVVTSILEGQAMLHIHYTVEEADLEKFTEALQYQNTTVLTEMLAEKRIRLFSEKECLAGLAVKGEAYYVLLKPDINNNIDFSSPSMQASLSRSHQLDNLTGQVDRHAGNIKYVRQDDGTYSAVLIDNDLSMGSKVMGATASSLQRIALQGPTQPPAKLDRACQEALQTFKIEDWLNYMKHLSFTQDEIDAFDRRYQDQINHVTGGVDRSTETPPCIIVRSWNAVTYRQQLSASPCNSYVAFHALARVTAAKSKPEFEQLLIESLQGNGALIRDCLYDKNGIYSLFNTSLPPEEQDRRRSLLQLDSKREEPIILREALLYPSYSKVLTLYHEAANTALLTRLITEDLQGAGKIIDMALEQPQSTAAMLFKCLNDQQPGILQQLTQTLHGEKLNQLTM